VRQSDQYTKTTREIAKHGGRIFNDGVDASVAVEKLALPAFLTLRKAQNGCKIRICETFISDHIKRVTYLIETIKTLNALTWEQCSEIMRQMIEEHDTLSAVSRDGDGLGLIKPAKSIDVQFQSPK
jgi:hypothetical protein